MKKLADIIRNSNVHQIIGSDQIEISDFCLDSRIVIRGALFVAMKGVSADGHDFIPKAIENGAIGILCEKVPNVQHPQVTYIESRSVISDLSIMLENYFGNASKELSLIGITGTNGKTTTATLLFELFKQLGYKCGLISTVRNIIHDRIIESTHTTPDIISLYKLLSEMRSSGCSYVFMEVSSHAIDQDRIQGLKFKVGVFTNITHDHLDYHLTFKNYIQAKKKFFDHMNSESFALSNVDDPNGNIMLQNTKAKKAFYGIRNMADYKGKILDNNLQGLQMRINGYELHSRLIGEFNAYNLLAVFGVSDVLGMNVEEVLIAMSGLHSVDGRFDWIQNAENAKIGIVDYAHTPDALEKILNTIVKIKSKNQKIITVVGCGGNRDRTKRPEMAEVVTSISDMVIFTSDNPRDESPEEIIKEMENGVKPEFQKKYISLIDREQAIKTACLLSKDSDIILVAGKGHEKYQEIKGIKYPFDDLEKLKTYLLN